MIHFRLAFLSTFSAATLFASDVKLSRDEAWSPEQTLQSIELDGPYEAQLVATEPLVKDPVEMCWDSQGRCFVADMLDYPLGGPDGKRLSRIQQLIDTDADGRYDKAVTFADDLDHAQGLLPFRDGLIVTTRTQILFLRDTDGDGIADERKPLVEGFNPSFSQLQVASPRWGLEGSVYFNNGLDTKEIYPIISDEIEPPKIDVARHNLRWNPITKELKPASGFGQYGGTFDDWGRHFFSSNRSPIMFAVMPQEAVARAASGLTQGWENIAPFGADSRVYPFKITHTTSDAHSGTNTSACGLAVYRGDLMPELRGDVFVCDPTGQLITRFKRPERQGSSLITNRVGQQFEYFRSRDEWCRPVNVTTGPDGAIYVCDIYRQYIDHARFFPDEFAKTHDLRSGEHEGRIWRIVPKGGTKRPIEGLPSDIQSLVKGLFHDNAWQRETSQRLLLEKAAQEGVAIEILRTLKTSKADDLSVLTKLHHLWTFAGVWNQLSPEQKISLATEDWFAFLGKDSTPELTENLVMLALRYPGLCKGHEDELWTRAFVHGDARSRMLYLATTELAPEKATLEIEAVCNMTGELNDSWIQGAILGRFTGHHGQLAQRLLESDFAKTASASKVELVRKLTLASSASGLKSDFEFLLQTLRIQPAEMLWWKLAMLQGLAEGLPKSAGTFGGKSLQAFIADPSITFGEYRIELHKLLTKVDAIIEDPEASLEQRIAALPLLTQRSYDKAGPLLKRLLKNNQAPALSQATFATLQRFGAVQIAPLLYEILPSVNPALRQEIVTVLSANQKTVLELFQRMERDEVSRSLVDAETRWRYLQSQDATLKELAEKLFKRPSEDRAAVITAYLPSLTMKGDAKRGQEIFTSICTVCHRYQGKGVAVGPDISDVRAKEKEALLSDILDPNRMIEARWSAYHIEAKDGRILVGIVEAETSDAITLKLPGGLQQTLNRAEIATQKVTNSSLMPVGLEGGINVNQMADLLAFLRGEE